jgi:hypothetical protein
MMHPNTESVTNDIALAAMPSARQVIGVSPKVKAFIQLGFENLTFFHALIAFAQGYKEVATTGTTQPSPMVLFHRGMATRGLHARLKDPATCADDISILITWKLLDNAWRYGENETGQQHYAGLLKMIEMRGGLDRLGIKGILRAVIDFGGVTDMGDSLGGFVTTSPPSLRYPTQPFSTLVCSMIERLPSGYAEIALQGILSVETIATIRSLNEWLDSDPGLRTPAPHNQIGSARRCIAAMKSTDRGSIEEAVCLGIIIISMRSFHARFARMDRVFLDQIVGFTRQFDIDDQEISTRSLVEREHLAFIILVAVEASEKCIELQNHVKTLVVHLLRREEFARSWEGMEHVVRKFFWIPFAFTHWKVSWLRHLKDHAEAEAIAAGRRLSHAEDEVIKP